MRLRRWGEKVFLQGLRRGAVGNSGILGYQLASGKNKDLGSNGEYRTQLGSNSANLSSSLSNEHENHDKRSGDKPNLPGDHRKSISSVYLHFPFCRSKCPFCDFSVQALGSSSNTDKAAADETLMDRYLDEMQNEIVWSKRIFELVYPESDWNLETSIYVGGGTPSLMSPKNILKFGRMVEDKFGSRKTALEFTFEAMPGTESVEKLESMSSIGINRISVGLQSMQESELKELGRVHSVSNIQKALSIFGNCSHLFGKQNLEFINLDLLMGVPNQTVDSYLNSLQLLVNFNPGHISSYILELHESTPYGRKYVDSQSPLPPNDSVCDMFAQGRQLLGANGYTLYQISNYAKSLQLESTHNKMYWEGTTPYLAFGSGAASLFGGMRFTRPKSVSSYFRYVQSLSNILLKLEKTPESERPSLLFNSLSQVQDGILNEDSTPISRVQSILIGGLSTVRGVEISRLLRTLFPENGHNPDNKVSEFLALIDSNLLLKQRLEVTTTHIRPRGDAGLLVSDGLVFEMCQVCELLRERCLNTNN